MRAQNCKYAFAANGSVIAEVQERTAKLNESVELTNVDVPLCNALNKIEEIYSQITLFFGDSCLVLQNTITHESYSFPSQRKIKYVSVEFFNDSLRPRKLAFSFSEVVRNFIKIHATLMKLISNVSVYTGDFCFRTKRSDL